jgi:hypothetical protein
MPTNAELLRFRAEAAEMLAVAGGEEERLNRSSGERRGVSPTWIRESTSSLRFDARRKTKAAGGALPPSKPPTGPAPPRRSVCAPGRCFFTVARTARRIHVAPRDEYLTGYGKPATDRRIISEGTRSRRLYWIAGNLRRRPTFGWRQPAAPRRCAPWRGFSPTHQTGR